MTEDRIFFISEGLRIEALLQDAPGDRAAVITHPHPLYGGDMHNTVVTAIARAYRLRGWATLRFNFRGVGGSQGEYDEGRGEQEDLKAAIAYLQSRDKHRIDLAGYSG